MGLPETAGPQRSVRRCELGTNEDYQKYRQRDYRKNQGE